MAVVNRSNSNGSMTIDLWYDDPFTPKRYGADVYVDSQGGHFGTIYDGTGMTIGDFTATDSTIIEDNFLVDWDFGAKKVASSTDVSYSENPSADAYYQIMNILDARAKSGGGLSDMDKAVLDGLLTMCEGDIEDIADANDCGECHSWDALVEALKELFATGERIPVGSSIDVSCSSAMSATKPDGDADTIHFWYGGKELGVCSADDMQCPALLDLIRSNKHAATAVLNYLNSLGDPVYPISDEDWQTPETDVDNVDKTDLYYTLLQELGYEYDEVDFSAQDEFYAQFGSFEIFSDDTSISSAESYTSSNPLLVEAPRGDYYVWEEFGKFKGSVQNPNARIVDARKITTFDDFESLDEVVEYVKKYF